MESIQRQTLDKGTPGLGDSVTGDTVHGQGDKQCMILHHHSVIVDITKQEAWLCPH